MMKYFIASIVTILLAVAAVTANAAPFTSLTFVKTDGSKVSFSVDGLKITYDDFAHAVITNDETTDVIDLSELDYMFFSNSDSLYLKGDVNGDGEVNIADINALIDVILGSNHDDDVETRADVNGDGEVNVADINAVIDIILAM